MTFKTAADLLDLGETFPIKRVACLTTDVYPDSLFTKVLDTLLEEGWTVTILDNLSRGNMGAVRVLEAHAKPGQLSTVIGDIGDRELVERVLRHSRVDIVMHFAAIAFVGESTREPLRYWHNITSNTLALLEAMDRVGVRRLIYSSTCATYGNAEEMPITEQTPTVPVNPYASRLLDIAPLR